jgi:hypothetical protein
MSFFDNARQSKFVKHTEKLENMSRFLGYYLDRLSVVEHATPGQRSVTLFARSPSSPASRALLEVMPEMGALKVAVKVLFNRLEPSADIGQWLTIACKDGAAGPALSLRWARKAALCDAHEQMVLGTTLSWLGDCMRRDPEARDAFETFDIFNGEAARRSSQAFLALWSASEPFGNAIPALTRVSSGELAAVASAAMVSDELRPASGTLVGTRH